MPCEKIPKCECFVTSVRVAISSCDVDAVGRSPKLRRESPSDALYFVAGMLGALGGAGVAAGGVVDGCAVGPGAGNVCLAAGGGAGVPLTTDAVPR